MTDDQSVAVAPAWVQSDANALGEWTRVVSSVPAERRGILALYCSIYGRLVHMLGTDEAHKVSALVGQFRTLAATLFGTGSQRHQPGKNPFADLKRARRAGAAVLYHVFFEEFGEWDAFFSPDGDLVAHWHCNDAMWRTEYMSDVVEYFDGYVITADINQRKEFKRTFAARLRADGNL
ncbi:MAG: hypothetical protein ACREDY_28860 [Bradyrhizobium sp.]